MASAPTAPTDLTADPYLAGYAFGLFWCFGISHITVINDTLTRRSPRVYPYFNVILPFGRCVFALAICERLASRKSAEQ